MKTRTVFVSLALALASIGHAHANLLVNGSFEAQNDSPYLTVTVGQNQIPGFAVVGVLNTNVTIFDQSFTEYGLTFNAQDGSQWLDLTGISSAQGQGIAQTVATTAGDTYQLSYYIGNIDNPTYGLGTTSTVDVSINGSLVFTDTNATQSQTSIAWTQYIHTFTATSATTTLSFYNGDPAGDDSNGIDNLVLTDLTASGVPVDEPATLGMLVSGLILVAACGRASRGRVAGKRRLASLLGIEGHALGRT